MVSAASASDLVYKDRMANPRAIQVHCDGAMNLDTAQTGGNGFIIEFPESIELEPISKALRNDGQGIHRLEMISVIEAMEELLRLDKANPGLLRKAAAVEIYTDRLRITDGELGSPWRIREYRKNKWKTHEGKPVKDSDLWNSLDKTRTKLTAAVGGRVEVRFERENKNRVADKLSREGRRGVTKSRKIRLKKNRNVTKRLTEGSEIKYPLLSPGDVFPVRVYAWEPVGEQYEICSEILDGEFAGKILKMYVSQEEKRLIHRTYSYDLSVKEIFAHHCRGRFIAVG